MAWLPPRKSKLQEWPVLLVHVLIIRKAKLLTAKNKNSTSLNALLNVKKGRRNVPKIKLGWQSKKQNGSWREGRGIVLVFFLVNLTQEVLFLHPETVICHLLLHLQGLHPCLD